MTKTIGRLTARQVESDNLAPGRHADGGNLYLSVSKSGGRSWTFVYRWHGGTREAGLGKAGKGDVTLAEARRKAEQGRAMLNAKPPVNPLDAWRKPAAEARRVPTFAEAARDYIETHAPSWRNAKHEAQWKMTVLGGAKLAGPDGIRREAVRNAKREYCRPLHNLPCDKIETRDVLGVLKPLWTRAPETASRLRGQSSPCSTRKRRCDALTAKRAISIRRDGADISTLYCRRRASSLARSARANTIGRRPIKTFRPSLAGCAKIRASRRRRLSLRFSPPRGPAK